MDAADTEKLDGRGTAMRVREGLAAELAICIFLLGVIAVLLADRLGCAA